MTRTVATLNTTHLSQEVRDQAKELLEILAPVERDLFFFAADMEDKTIRLEPPENRAIFKNVPKKWGRVYAVSDTELPFGYFSSQLQSFQKQLTTGAASKDVSLRTLGLFFESLDKIVGGKPLHPPHLEALESNIPLNLGQAAAKFNTFATGTKNAAQASARDRLWYSSQQASNPEDCEIFDRCQTHARDLSGHFSKEDMTSRLASLLSAVKVLPPVEPHGAAVGEMVENIRRNLPSGAGSGRG